MWTKWRVALLMLIDVFLVNAALFIAFYLRFYEEGGIPPSYFEPLANVYILSTIIYLISFNAFKLYNRVWSYASTGELLAVINSVTTGALGTVTASFLFRTSLPRSVIILAWAFTILLIGGSRFIWRLYIQRQKTNGLKNYRRALIIGAGDAGALVAREMNHSDHIGLCPVGFIDDDQTKLNQSLLGVPILGTREDIPEIVSRHNIDEIIIAMPSVDRQVIKDTVEICRSTPAEVRILPGVYEIIDGKVSVERIRPVKLEDLLGREPVSVDLGAIASYLKDKVILVTGAGGSIGSELCRQIVSFSPRRLVILGHGENSIHKIWQELEESCPGLDLAVEIADIRDFHRIQYVFNKHRPSVIFHAAAHKHVPLMEMHPGEAVQTNVLGTRNVAEVAHRVGAEIFIMISTDKAVNPTSVMGATKRLAEVIIRQLNNNSKTIFAAVRFGNVLGSNGSVVPVFERQIKNGGPVTVTHPEMKRFFMTIPEAVSLVIQAGSMAKGGEVFVLDMGEQIKIVDLAREMIRLSGLEPEKDIEIIFTGIRPGEKLLEELMTEEEGASATRHKKIFVGRPGLINATALEKEIDSLEESRQEVNLDRILLALKRIIPGFTSPRLIQETILEKKGLVNIQS